MGDGLRGGCSQSSTPGGVGRRRLINGEQTRPDAKGTPRKGNPKTVTEALLLERARKDAETAAALAPPRLSIEAPT